MVNNVECRFFAVPRYSCFQEREENISHKILSLDFLPDRVSEWLGRDCGLQHEGKYVSEGTIFEIATLKRHLILSEVLTGLKWENKWTSESTKNYIYYFITT